MSEDAVKRDRKKFDPYVIDDSFEEALTYEKVFGTKKEKNDSKDESDDDVTK